jgi:hypothetical protein
MTTPVAAEWSLRAKGKARSLKVLLRTSVAASAIFADALRTRSFSFLHGPVLERSYARRTVTACGRVLLPSRPARMTDSGVLT